MTVETKFNIGDEVWFIYHSKARQGEIDDIGLDYYTVKFGDKKRHLDVVSANHVFKTKEELIESLFN